MSTSPSPYAPPETSTPPAPPRATGQKPNAAIAVVLSLCAMGIGHVYAGNTRRGIAWASTPFAFILGIKLLSRFGGKGFFSYLVLCILAQAIAWIGGMIDVLRIARSPQATRAPAWRVALAYVALVGLSIVLATATRRFVVEAFKVPSGSMIPTIAIGDHLFVDKAFRAVKRGDVIVFKYPERPSDDFVKRVIALPGDRIEFRSGVPIVNGTEIPRCRVGPYSYKTDEDHEGEIFVESLDGHAYLAFYDSGFDAGYQGPWTVKAGDAFVAGDNRMNAYDSRHWFGGRGGGMPLANVKGTAFVVWMAFTKDGRIDWDRVGSPIDEMLLPRSSAILAPQLARCVEQLRSH